MDHNYNPIEVPSLMLPRMHQSNTAQSTTDQSGTNKLITRLIRPPSCWCEPNKLQTMALLSPFIHPGYKKVILPKRYPLSIIPKSLVEE
jgi:hypothetical protein